MIETGIVPTLQRGNGSPDAQASSTVGNAGAFTRGVRELVGNHASVPSILSYTARTEPVTRS